jgi:hypothetical protein
MGKKDPADRIPQKTAKGFREERGEIGVATGISK